MACRYGTCKVYATISPGWLKDAKMFVRPMCSPFSLVLILIGGYQLTKSYCLSRLELGAGGGLVGLAIALGCAMEDTNLYHRSNGYASSDGEKRCSEWA